MMYCLHCGRPVDAGRFCSGCGRPITPAVDTMGTKLKRHRNEMLLILASFGMVFAFTAGLIVSRVMHVERGASGPLSSTETTAPVTQQQQPLSASLAVAQAPRGQPLQQPPQEIIAQENNSASRSSTGSIDPKAVQNLFTTLTQSGKQAEPSLPRLPAPSTVSTESDRYPGSQPIEVKDAHLPDIGVPVTSEVYTTTDSLSTVVAYYTQRYSDAEVTEVSGRKIIALDRPGAAKVIAIGTTGEETRIAILKQAN